MKLKDLPVSQVILGGILTVASFFRLYDLSRGDPISDEVLYGFRAIGMLDFDFAVSQPTPLQLFHTSIPWWTHLSFHDHPLLVFLVQHWFMGMFGVNLWGLRLSSAVFGILSIYLVYLIGKKLFSAAAGLIAAALCASNVIMFYVSRVGVQESQVIFFILLTVYCFLQARDDARWYLLLGAAFGLAMLSKYTAIFLLVPCICILILYRRTAFSNWKLYCGGLIGLGMFSPAIIYNIFLYRTFGHFDFQLFYIFGQNVPQWHATPGKEIGSLTDRIVGIPVNLWQYASPLFLIVAVVAIISCIAVLVRQRRKKEKGESLVFVLTAIGANLLLYCAVGPAPRFLTLLIPWLTLAVGFSMSKLLETGRLLKMVTISLLGIMLSIETAYAINSTVVYSPRGTEVLTYSKIHWDTHAWGYTVLDDFILNTIKGLYPSRTIPYNLEFLEEVKQRYLDQPSTRAKKSAAILFVYSANMSDLATLWVMNRHALYEAWPMIDADTYRETVRSEGGDYYTKGGFTDIYFIMPTENVLLNPPDRRSGAGDELGQQLAEEKIEPMILKNHQGVDAFRVYHRNIDKKNEI